MSKFDILLLIAALAALLTSEILWFNGDKLGALFTGLWVPSILAFGVFLKLIKLDVRTKKRKKDEEK